ncbi:MAG: hypothetical protein ACXWDO_01400 [Bacteroidia bacterium]
MTEKLRSIFDNYFKFLTDDFGFIVESSHYDSEAFGNFSIILSNGPKKIRIVSDRSQIFIDISDAGFSWKSKEDILEEKDISKNRFNITEGLWDGYKIENQSSDLQKHLSLLL